MNKIRKFKTGATRDTDENKFDYEGFYNPIVIQRFASYMNKHRKQSDGQLRDSDNWQKGIPKNAYIKSGLRHFMDWWLIHRGYEGREDLEEALCALIFNAQGYLFEILKNKQKSKICTCPYGGGASREPDINSDCEIHGQKNEKFK